MHMRQLITSYCLFLILLSGVCACSSDNDNSFIDPQQTAIALPKEGGTKDIAVSTSDWSIIRIVEADGSTPISGDIAYGSDEKDVQGTKEGVPLALSSADYGKLTALTSKRGFTISRYHPHTLSITLDENYTLSPFSFVIVLQSGNQTQEVTVTQAASNRYKMKSIDYSVGEGDGTSYYWEDDTDETLSMNIGGIASYNFVTTPKSIMSTLTFQRFCTALFSSDETGAFLWPSVEDSAPDVKVPLRVSNGTLEYHSKTVEYNAQNKGLLVSFPFSDKVSVTLKEGLSKMHFKFEMEKTIVTYTLTLTDSVTGAERSYQGKWTSIQPTGKYELVVENEK